METFTQKFKTPTTVCVEQFVYLIYWYKVGGFHNLKLYIFFLIVFMYLILNTTTLHLGYKWSINISKSYELNVLFVFCGVFHPTETSPLPLEDWKSSSILRTPGVEHLYSNHQQSMMLRHVGPSFRSGVVTTDPEAYYYTSEVFCSEKAFSPLQKRFISFSKRFVPSTNRSVSFTKCSDSFSRRFVPYKQFKSFCAKRFVQSGRKSSGVVIVIIRIANWQLSRISAHLFEEYFSYFMYQDFFYEIVWLIG